MRRLSPLALILDIAALDLPGFPRRGFSLHDAFGLVRSGLFGLSFMDLNLLWRSHGELLIAFQLSLHDLFASLCHR